jgi:hypothetical protein
MDLMERFPEEDAWEATADLDGRLRKPILACLLSSNFRDLIASGK